MFVLVTTGLGSKVEDICGRDWVESGGDHGDPGHIYFTRLSRLNTYGHFCHSCLTSFPHLKVNMLFLLRRLSLSHTQKSANVVWRSRHSLLFQCTSPSCKHGGVLNYIMYGCRFSGSHIWCEERGPPSSTGGVWAHAQGLEIWSSTQANDAFRGTRWNCIPQCCSGSTSSKTSGFRWQSFNATALCARKYSRQGGGTHPWGLGNSWPRGCQLRN